MLSLLKAKKKRTDPRGGGGGYPLSDLPVSPPKTRIEPHIFILRASRLIICKHLRHLRCGQLPSAGPRQKKGAGLRGMGPRTWLGWGWGFPPFPR
jgi:hypothetical protein